MSASHPLALTSPLIVQVYLESVYEQIRNFMVDFTEYCDLVVQNEHSRNGIVTAMEELFHTFQVSFTPYPSAPSIDHLLPRRYRAYAVAVQHASEHPQDFIRVAEEKIRNPLRAVMEQLWAFRNPPATRVAMPTLPNAGEAARGEGGATPSVPDIAGATHKALAKIIHRLLRLHVAQCTHVIACWTPMPAKDVARQSCSRHATQRTSPAPIAGAENVNPFASPPPPAFRSEERSAVDRDGVKTHSMTSLDSTNQSRKLDCLTSSTLLSSPSSSSTHARLSSVELSVAQYSRKAVVHRLQVAMSKISFDFDRLIHVCTNMVRNVTQLTQDIVHSNVEPMRPVMLTMERISKNLRDFIYTEYSWFFFDVEKHLAKNLSSLTKSPSLLTRIADSFLSSASSPPHAGELLGDAAAQELHRDAAAHHIPCDPPSQPVDRKEFLATFFSSSSSTVAGHSSRELPRFSATGDSTGTTTTPPVRGHRRRTHEEKLEENIQQINQLLSALSIKYLHAFGKCFYVEKPLAVRGRTTKV